MTLARRCPPLSKLLEDIITDWSDQYQYELAVYDKEKAALEVQATKNTPKYIREAWQYYILDDELHSRGTPGLAQFLKHINKYFVQVSKRHSQITTYTDVPSGPSEDDIRYANIGELKKTASFFPTEVISEVLDLFKAPANYYIACGVDPPEGRSNYYTVAAYPLVIESALEAARGTGKLFLDESMFIIYNWWRVVIDRRKWRRVEGEGVYYTLQRQEDAELVKEPPLAMPPEPGDEVEWEDIKDFF